MVHCVQLFYNLSDPGMEDLLYEAESVRRFVGETLRPVAGRVNETSDIYWKSASWGRD